MKFGLMYANGGLYHPETLTHLATTAERVGVSRSGRSTSSSRWATSRPIPTALGGPAPDQLPIPDPLVALAYAAVTKTLRLATGI
jgi:alkanesulfonate monooxygenase SsuD/methylene tetrahydromethanopterin reductase-like flavin-dependent oxidoreductase (luciferase family)